jgi:hypothetical protein
MITGAGYQWLHSELPEAWAGRKSRAFFQPLHSW